MGYLIFKQLHFRMHYMLKDLFKLKIDYGNCIFAKWHLKEDYLKFLVKEHLKLINILEVLITLILQEEL